MASASLRPAMASLAPLIETIRLDLALSFGVVGLLTTIPVVCLGVFPIAANRLATNIGLERALLAALGLITLATALRLAGDQTALLFLSTLIIGIGVAGGQAYVPAITKRYFGAKAPAITALYGVIMTASAVVVVAATPVLAYYLGSWPAGLAIWSVPALLAVALWIPIAHRSSPAPRDIGKQIGLPWRNAVAWRITSFSSVAFLLFFSILAWYAPIYQAQGWNQGNAASLLAVLLVTQLVSAVMVMVATTRQTGRRLLIVLGTLLSVAGLAGVAFAPLFAPWVWAASTGLGLGVLFTLTLTMPVEFGANPEEVGRLTAMAMSVGYLIAALGPVVIGLLRDLTGSFELPIVLLGALVLIFTAPALQLPYAVRSDPI